MRLIDADTFKENMERKYGFYARQPQDDIDAQPTVDAVPVVRCMDCEYGKVSDTKGCVWCTCYEINKSLNGFCDYGEMKDGEQDGKEG